MGNSVIEFEGVSFDGPPEGGPGALEDVDLAVGAGAIVAVVGPAPATTSALIRLVAGLERPGSGRVRIGDHPVVGPDPRVGLAFSDPALLPWRTLRQNVRLPLEIASGDHDGDRVDSLLAAAGLEDHADAYPSDLGVEGRHRVALCRALALAPDVLALDDPFGQLDVLAREDLWEVLNALRGDTTCVLATTDLREAVYLAERVAVLGGAPARLRSTLDVDVADTGEANDLYSTKAAHQLSILRHQIDVARGRAEAAMPAAMSGAKPVAMSGEGMSWESTR